MSVKSRQLKFITEILYFLLLYNGEITIIGKQEEETRARQVNRHKKKYKLYFFTITNPYREYHSGTRAFFKSVCVDRMRYI